jgi:FixJ family two-component response regulator
VRPVSQLTLPPVKNEECKVYLLDDDDSVRKALSRLLRAEGLNSQAFSSGEAFLAGLPETAHGCVVMDIRMPGLTGHDVQQQLRRRGQSIPVIALSAQDDGQARQRARELGAVAYFRKPVDDQALLDSIHWLLSAPAPATS